MGLLVLADAAGAQEAPRRTGADRQVVVQLAYTLGEAHALRRLCAGPGESTWFGRMQRLESQEAADDAARAQLVESFNAGFAARQAQFVECSRRSRATERAVAQRGAALAQRLSADPQP
ncbi:TIGR02301 family protein [Caulobacter sp. S45]|uniref:TIGR02301 family protein n=1 Tax=Caulobacter sp. S45 TaxID=1641861 RepID=UPI0015752365|nr:TIGR02301 family protein [Caulobacter sp. S45]